MRVVDPRGVGTYTELQLRSCCILICGSRYLLKILDILVLDTWLGGVGLLWRLCRPPVESRMVDVAS